MWKAIERSALCAVSTLLGAVLFTACSSDGTPRESMQERRLRSERDAAATLNRGSAGDAADVLALGDGAAIDEAFLVADGGGQADEDDDVFGEEDELEDLDAEPEEPPRARRRTTRPTRRPRSRAGAGSADEVLRELRADREAERAEAEFYVRKGNAAYANNRFEEARDAFRRALDLDPSLEDARQKWNEVKLLLNERSGEPETVSKFFTDQAEVGRQQAKIEVARNLDLGRQAFSRGDVDRAERLVGQAVAMIERDVHVFENSELDAARQFLEEVRREKSRQEDKVQLDKLRSASRQAERESSEQEARTRRQVQDLLRKAARFIRREDYRKAVQTCESVLVLDPDNKIASFWLRNSKDQLLKERRFKMITDRIENREILNEEFHEATTPYQEFFVFSDDFAERTHDRKEQFQTVDFGDPEPIRNIKRALEGSRIRDLSFEDTPLSEVVATFRQISGVNIIVNPDVEAEEVRITQPINDLPAMSALRLILEANNLAFSFDENIMVINNKGETSVPTVFEIYNVSDLLMRVRDFAAPEIRLTAGADSADSPISFTDSFEEEDEPLDSEGLIQLIQDSTGGDEVWGDEFSIDFSQGQLFVDAPRELHQQLAKVLENLRQDSDLFVVIEARFIDINDDFLEDIGLDARALGVVNNLGTPFGGVINDSATGGNDIGIVEQGDLDDVNLNLGLDRWAGRVQHIIDGFSGAISGENLNGGNGIGGGTFQATWLEPFQVNVILRAIQEKADIRQLTAPVITAHNNERVYVSVITQRAYIADYELVSGGTGFSIIEVADPVVQTFQEGVILDVDPTISHDKKYVTLDVRPTLATLIGGVISTIQISLGSFLSVAFQVPIGIPQIALQQSFTSVTVPNGGTVLLGGFKSLNERKFTSYLPILGKIPIVKSLARRKATISEKRSLVILLTARIVDLRGEEERRFNKS